MVFAKALHGEDLNGILSTLGGAAPAAPAAPAAKVVEKKGNVTAFSSPMWIEPKKEAKKKEEEKKEEKKEEEAVGGFGDIFGGEEM